MRLRIYDWMKEFYEAGKGILRAISFKILISTICNAQGLSQYQSSIEISRENFMYYRSGLQPFSYRKVGIQERTL